MKMIAAILAVLAVALGGVYALDTAQADDVTVTLEQGQNPVELKVGDIATFSVANPPAGGEWNFTGEDYASWDVDTQKLTATAVGTATVKYMQPSGQDDPLFTDYAICTVTIVAADVPDVPDEPEEPVELDPEGPIWPAPAYDDEHDFAPWSSEADWEESDDYVYWIDGEYVTILDCTQIEIFTKQETYRVRAILPEGQALDSINPLDVHVEIEFFNFREDTYMVQSTTITPQKLELATSETMDADVGTIYLTGLKILLQGGVTENGKYKPFSLPITVPVMMKKINISDEYEFEYVYNGLYQSPLKELNDDNSAASDLYYEGDNPVPYINPVYFEYPDLSDMLPEGYVMEWLVNEDSTSVAINTNKFEAMVELQEYAKDAQGNYVDDDDNIITLDDLLVPYVITITPADDSFVIGTITITWWIVPLSLDDIEFDIRDPYYDYDNEVRPKVVMKWYEPEDGPNGAKVHYILPEKVDIEYIMPDEYPYAMPVTLVPAYKQAVDEETGEPLTIEAVDEYGNVIMVPELDDQGNIVYVDATDPDTGDIIYEQEYQPVVDPETGDPLEEQAVDADGNPLFRHWRYEDGSFAYYQLVDEDGNYVYEVDDDGNFILDVNGNKIPVYDLPVYDEETGELISEGSPYMVPVMVPVYEYVDTENPVQVPNMVPQMIPVYELDDDGNPIPEEVQAVDDYYRPVYSEFAYEQKKYEDGSLVWEQKVSAKGKPVYEADGVTPVWDETKPVMVVAMEQVFYPELDDNDNIVYQDDGVTPVWTDSPVLDDEGNPVYAVKYDADSDPVMVQKLDEVVADFTATQVGYPYDDWVFDYGIHIVADTGFYEFDTDDYVPAVDPVTGAPIFAQAVDAEGNLITRTVQVEEDVFETVPVIDPTKPLFDASYIVVDDEENDTFYLTYVGDLYDEERFVWHIIPIEFQSEWYDYEEGVAIVPEGATDYYGVPAPVGDYEVVDLEDYYYIVIDNMDWGTYTLPAGQYVETETPAGFGIVFPEGANFIGDVTFTSLNSFFAPLTLNVDTIEVTGILDLETLKKAVHFYPMDMYPQFRTFTIDDFSITVLNGDGEVVIFQDQVVRNILASDWYTITVTGNMANGYYGALFGSFFIDKEASQVEVTEFQFVDDPDYKNGVRITGYTGNATDIVIPDYIDGKKVTSIGAKAFYGTDITSVVFGDNVRKVHDKAFAACSKLKSVEFSDSVQVIGAYAFSGDKAINKVVFGNGLKAVRTGAFSVKFLSGIATEDYTGQTYVKGTQSNSIPAFVPVYANYTDENGKTQYYAQDALAGKVFAAIEDVDGLVGMPLDLFFDDERLKVPVVDIPFNEDPVEYRK